MKKIHPVTGKLEDYPDDIDDYNEWVVEHGSHKSEFMDKPNLVCSCGNDEFKVEWWDYPYVGGRCVVYCAKCGEKRELIDDYA